MKGPHRGNHAYSSLRTGDFDEEGNNPTLMYADKRLKDQDSSLESLGKSVSRLGELSLTISKEIDTQNRLLDNLEVDVDRAKESTDSILKRTKELVAKSGGYKMVCIIVVLIAILILLIFLVIYT
jgi:t-SNARE complex subunit (syntaxin)